MMAKTVRRKSFWLTPLIEIYGFLGAMALYLLFQLSRWTCRFEIHGKESLVKNAHTIWACWHEHTGCAFVAFPVLCKYSRPQSWLVHPAWVMRPVHRLMDLYGIEKVMGASGARGREGIEALLKHLASGRSTCLNPDGPAGPKRVLKPGVLTLSQDSRMPILAISYRVHRGWTWPGWDQKRIPFPFSKVEIRVSAPLGSDDPAVIARELSFYS